MNEFGLSPPTLAEYLPLDETLPPPPDVYQDDLPDQFHYGL